MSNMYLCAKQLFSKKIANIVLFLYAISPSFILYSEFVATEILYTFLLSVLFYFAIRFQKKGSIVLGILFGIFTAVLNCIRPCGLVTMIAFLLYAVCAVVPKRRLLAVALSVLCYAGCNAGFSKTIEYLNGKPIASLPIGYNLYVGANTESMGYWNEKDAEYFGELMQNADLSPNDIHSRLTAEGIQRLQTNGLFENIKLGFLKFGLDYAEVYVDANSCADGSLFHAEAVTDLAFVVYTGSKLEGDLSLQCLHR